MFSQCPTCGTPVIGQVCQTCVSELAQAARAKQHAIVNEIMSELDKEADEVFEKDPTKARGRGPKWLTS